MGNVTQTRVLFGVSCKERVLMHWPRVAILELEDKERLALDRVSRSDGYIRGREFEVLCMNGKGLVAVHVKLFHDGIFLSRAILRLGDVKAFGID